MQELSHSTINDLAGCRVSYCQWCGRLTMSVWLQNHRQSAPQQSMARNSCSKWPLTHTATRQHAQAHNRQQRPQPQLETWWPRPNGLWRRTGNVRGWREKTGLLKFEKCKPMTVQQLVTHGSRQCRNKQGHVDGADAWCVHTWRCGANT